MLPYAIDPAHGAFYYYHHKTYPTPVHAPRLEPSPWGQYKREYQHPSFRPAPRPRSDYTYPSHRGKPLQDPLKTYQAYGSYSNGGADEAYLGDISRESSYGDTYGYNHHSQSTRQSYRDERLAYSGYPSAHWREHKELAGGGRDWPHAHRNTFNGHSRPSRTAYPNTSTGRSGHAENFEWEQRHRHRNTTPSHGYKSESEWEAEGDESMYDPGDQHGVTDGAPEIIPRHADDLESGQILEEGARPTPTAHPDSEPHAPAGQSRAPGPHLDPPIGTKRTQSTARGDHRASAARSFPAPPPMASEERPSRSDSHIRSHPPASMAHGRPPYGPRPMWNGRPASGAASSVGGPVNRTDSTHTPQDNRSNSRRRGRYEQDDALSDGWIADREFTETGSEEDVGMDSEDECSTCSSCSDAACSVAPRSLY
ncbi:hypothetical protein HGRIS_010225 [Hohenbuehelia grisea]|uniref:Uncharacterized protein n=1 Tax=Hohenbuehelia grisea TaxID=104357 RepID=A0ABR3J3M9_9AGAR